jgi:Spy/CpxP family protein refolding chaperone
MTMGNASRKNSQEAKPGVGTGVLADNHYCKMKNPRNLLIVALSAALFSLPTIRAEEPAKTRDKGPGEGRREMRHEKMGERREKMGDRMAEELGLTEDQKARMKELRQAERAEMEALHKSAEPAKKEQREKAEAIHKSYMDKRQAILTPEQREKAGKMREKMEKRREHREMHRDMDHEKRPEQK